MSIFLSTLRPPCGLLLMVLVLGLCWLGAPAAHAQNQESGLLNRIERPDRTLKFEPADKSLSFGSTYGSKQARVKPFAFSHEATLRAGDGSFRTRAFAEKDKFNTRDFATKPDRASGDTFAQEDRGFATKTVPVRDAPGSGKSAGLARDYIPAQKSSVIHGKRQDTFDEIQSRKDFTIDEVRALLNKPDWRRGARPDVGTLPAARALPVTGTPTP